MGLMNFYSEYAEDRWIAENCEHFANVEMHRAGFYVDVGAMRPDQNSNTAFLRERGWAGIAIDGHPDCARHWAGIPVTYVNAVLAAIPQRTGFICREAGHEAESAMGIAADLPDWADPHREVPARSFLNVNATTLNAVLEREHVGTIDFLSIDTHGAEYAVLSVFDFDRYQPRIIVAEYHTPGLGKDYRLMELLLTTGHYTVVHQTPANLIYLRR